MWVGSRDSTRSQQYSGSNHQLAGRCKHKFANEIVKKG